MWHNRTNKHTNRKKTQNNKKKYKEAETDTQAPGKCQKLAVYFLVMEYLALTVP